METNDNLFKQFTVIFAATISFFKILESTISIVDWREHSETLFCCSICIYKISRALTKQLHTTCCYYPLIVRFLRDASFPEYRLKTFYWIRIVIVEKFVMCVYNSSWNRRFRFHEKTFTSFRYLERIEFLSRVDKKMLTS